MAKDKNAQNVAGSRHPDYSSSRADWQKWRKTYEGGDEYITQYLERYSQSETAYTQRKKVTFIPPFVKVALQRVASAISCRMGDVSRASTSDSYLMAADGKLAGVDRFGATINTFMTQRVIMELLLMGKVGVFVDNIDASGSTLADIGETDHPYLYAYTCEDICNWAPYEATSNFDSLLLRGTGYKLDANGLPSSKVTTYRHYTKTPNGVQLVELTGSEQTDSRIIDIPEIPFRVFKLSQSLMKDICDYQVALLNMSSSSVNFDIQANFPVFTQQKDLQAIGQETLIRLQVENMLKEQGKTGAEAEAELEKTRQHFGLLTGISYEKGFDRPDFVHPSSEPLLASMKHREALKAEIDQIVSSTLSAIQSSSNGESGNTGTVESGLAAIAFELQAGENDIARFWANYEGGGDYSISYPTYYTMLTDSERVAEASKILGTGDMIHSIEYNRHCAVRAARLIMNGKIPDAKIKMIEDELMSSDNPCISVETLMRSIEDGLCTRQRASSILGFPATEAAQAQVEYGERLRLMAISQGGAGTNQGSPAAQAAAGLESPNGPADAREAKKEQMGENG